MDSSTSQNAGSAQGVPPSVQLRPAAVVVGLGNPLMCDEGIGIRLLQELAVSADRFPDVQFLDLGTAGFELLHALAGRRLAMVLDCAYMGTAPGTLRRFTPTEVRTVKLAAGNSVHQTDVFGILELLEALGEAPAQVVIYGVEPRRVAPEPALSHELEIRLAEYVAVITDDLKNLDNHA